MTNNKKPLDKSRGKQKTSDKQETVTNKKDTKTPSTGRASKKTSSTASKTPKKKVTTASAKKTKASSGVAETKKPSAKPTEKPTTMEELLAVTGYELKAPQKGQVVDGVVTELTKRIVLVDIGGKTEGMVVDKEYEAARDLIADISVGDDVKVYVVSPENDRGQILLSLRRAMLDRRWETFAEHMESGESVEVLGLEVNRGGMIVQADGIRGFVPSSQFGKKYLGQMDQLINQRFAVQVIEVDREKNRLIFSERHISEADGLAAKAAALDVIKEKDEYDGVVTGIMPFGVFVTVDVPLEPSTKRTKKNEKSATTDKSSKPASGKADTTVSVGKVEGLVHISEISWEKVDDPNNYFRVGDTVRVQVLGVDTKSGKLNLSVKRLKDDPWSSIESKYATGNKVKGKVTRVAPFGIFVTLEPGVDGLIHVSKLPTGEGPQVGDEVSVYVENVDQRQRRMSLGIVLTEVPVGYK